MLALIYLRRLVSDDILRGKMDQRAESGWDRDELIELLEQYGVIDRVLQVRQHHLDSAVAALNGFPNAEGVQALHALASRALTRASVQGG